jgi:hypothetical protein
VTKLFKQYTGESERGQWTIQSGVLKDETGEIKLVISNAPLLAPEKYRDQVVEFRCTKGAKGGWTGVKRGEDKKDKKDNITISDRAEIILFSQEHQPEQAPNGDAKAAGGPQGASEGQNRVTTAAASQTPPQSQPAANTAKGKSTAEQMAEGIGRLTQVANTQYAAITVVHEYLVPLLKERGIQLDPVAVGALCQNMLIQCYYEKVHWNFPQKQFPIKKAASEGGPPAGP